jgi:hypothetical protein
MYSNRLLDHPRLLAISRHWPKQGSLPVLHPPRGMIYRPFLLQYCYRLRDMAIRPPKFMSLRMEVKPTFLLELMGHQLAILIGLPSFGEINHRCEINHRYRDMRLLMAGMGSSRDEEAEAAGAAITAGKTITETTVGTPGVLEVGTGGTDREYSAYTREYMYMSMHIVW